MELSQAPACCQKSMEKIGDIIEAAGCLEEVLAVAPSLAKPRARISLLGLLWGLASGIWSWRQNRKLTSQLLKPIVQNRLNLVIDLEIVNHTMRNDSELEKNWRNLRKEFQISRVFAQTKANNTNGNQETIDCSHFGRRRQSTIF